MLNFIRKLALSYNKHLYMHKILLLLAILLFSINPEKINAQNRIIKKADTAFKYKMYNIALAQYQKGFTKLKNADKSEKNRILFQIAECYRISGQNKEAVSQYKRVIRTNYYNIEPKLFFNLASLQLSMGDFDEAYNNFELYLEYIPDDIQAIERKESALRAEMAMKQPSRYEVKNVSKLNSRDGEWAPRYYNKDGSIVAFSSTREGVTGKKFDNWTGARYSDIFVAKINSRGQWSAPEKLDNNEKTSTSFNETDASFCNGGSTMYYTYCQNENKTKNRCVIYMSTFDGEAWADPTEVSINGDTVPDFIHPFITEDGNTLFFSSNKAGGYGGLDIWYAKGGGTEFGDPVNLGSAVNTRNREAYPFFRNDTLIYFSSEGHNSLGGYDIFKANKKGNTFSNVENLGYPINTNSDDFGICFLPDINKGLFSSNRKGSRGGDDIYSFYLPDIVYSLAGTIRNELSLQGIEDAEINLVGSDGMIVRTLSDSKGFYKFDNNQVRKNVTYKIIVDKNNFLGTEATETTVGLTASKDFIRDIILSPIPKEPIVLPEILYDLGKWDLIPKYQDSLMELIVLLEKNPRLIIELASHTDIRPIAIGNDVLSQHRAQAVVDYLILRGIHPERLVAKGYGDVVPLTINKPTFAIYENKKFLFDSIGVILTEEYINNIETEDMQEAAHSLNRRTEFSILRDDFIPSGASGVSTIINIANLEALNNIAFEFNPNNKPEIEIIVNGKGLTAIVDEKAKQNTISLDAAMQLITDTRISVRNFKDGKKAFDEDGEILPNQKLTIKEIKIGIFILKNIELTTENEVAADLTLNKSTLNRIGKYVIDEENMQLKFNK